MGIGKYLKMKREKMGMKQSEVAEALGYSTPQFISNVERGVSMPAAATLKLWILLLKLDERVVINLLLENKKKCLKRTINESRI